MDSMFDIFTDDAPAADVVTSSASTTIDTEVSSDSAAGAKRSANSQDNRNSVSDDKIARKKQRVSDMEQGNTSKNDPGIDPASVYLYTFDEGEANCTHEVAVPKPMTVEDLGQPRSDKPAKEYPFTLDSFQRTAVRALESGESVLVAAHTSAGKTAVAQYAVAMSFRDKQRVIYTSPLKALSNQKFRELQEEFGDVGLMTGDTTINPTATCLVMTTEIMRSMLYRGSEVMREVAWVIFDEVHYMRDRDRGVVWEESIVLVPAGVRFVFLSATIPNAPEFASWVAAVHRVPCHVVYTDYRPVPLQHYLFPSGSTGLHLVVDEKGEFREDNFHKALSCLESAPKSSQDSGGKRKPQQPASKKSGGSDIYKIVRVIMERNYDPVIVFAFSKRECEALATNMMNLDLNSDDERNSVEQIFNSAIDSLSDEDKRLPQVESLLPLLKRGIGIHHGGLLPLLKEIIEILFQEGLVKALFATETFSMGLNMPAKTVVFTNCRKWDGDQFRWVSGGEYIQMSGRAGRRGLDDRGICIMMVDEKMDPSVAKGMLKGHSDPLTSTFHLGYNMILNLMRVEESDPEHLIRRSFYQFQHDRQRPDWQKELEETQSKFDGMTIKDENAVIQYASLVESIQQSRIEVRQGIALPKYSLPYLQPGRIVWVEHAGDEWGIGVVINFQRHEGKEKELANRGATEAYTIDVAVRCKLDVRPPQPLSDLDAFNCDFEIIKLPLSSVVEFSQLRLKVPNNLKQVSHRKSLLNILQEATKRFKSGIPKLHPVEDMKIKDDSFKKLLRNIDDFESKIKKHPMHKAADKDERLDLLNSKKELQEEIRRLKKAIKGSSGVVFRSELKSRRRILRKLGYCAEDGVVGLKGRVACEVDAGHELIIAELIFNGVLKGLDPSVLAALMSCLVYDERGKDSNVKLREELNAPFRSLQEIAKKVATCCSDCRLEIDEEEFVEKFRPGLMEVVYAWTKGAKFADILKMTQGMFEGSIIRCIRRLEELLNQLADSAATIGDTDLQNSAKTAAGMIKRDIVFAASLYL